MSNIPQIDLWKEFFDVYKNFPELWKVKSDIFKDRNKKRKAWAKLLEIYQQIEKGTNEDSLKKRVGNIRTCYRRELKKTEDSQKSGAGEDEVYVPTLWYFEELEFFRDHEAQIHGVSTIDLQEEIEDASESVVIPKRKRISGQQINAERTELLKDALGHLKTKAEKDVAGIHSESWAASYRTLPPIQQIYAKKAIDEKLALGQLSLLSINSVIQPSFSTSNYESRSCTPPSTSYDSRSSHSRPSSSAAFYPQQTANAVVIPIEYRVQDLLNDSAYNIENTEN